MTVMASAQIPETGLVTPLADGFLSILSSVGAARFFEDSFLDNLALSKVRRSALIFLELSTYPSAHLSDNQRPCHFKFVIIALLSASTVATVLHQTITCCTCLVFFRLRCLFVDIVWGSLDQDLIRYYLCIYRVWSLFAWWVGHFTCLILKYKLMQFLFYFNLLFSNLWSRREGESPRRHFHYKSRDKRQFFSRLHVSSLLTSYSQSFLF